MSQSKLKNSRSIGFPPGLLGESGVRLDLLSSSNGGIAINKPAGVLIDSHPWYPKMPALVDGINNQVSGQKSEFIASGITEEVKGVYFIEPEVSGVALCGVGDSAIEALRNVYGSYKMQFTFEFLAQEDCDIEEAFDCDLPLAVHSRSQKILVSHKTGKQAQTYFKRLARMGHYSYWQASTDYLRMHQVRVHAMERGLRIVGESLYNQVKPVYLSDIKKRRYNGKRDEQPLYDGLHVHLKRLSWGSNVVEAGLPKKFQVVLAKLKQHLVKD